MDLDDGLPGFLLLIFAFLLDFGIQYCWINSQWPSSKDGKIDFIENLLKNYLQLSNKAWFSIRNGQFEKKYVMFCKHKNVFQLGNFVISSCRILAWTISKNVFKELKFDSKFEKFFFRKFHWFKDSPANLAPFWLCVGFGAMVSITKLLQMNVI